MSSLPPECHQLLVSGYILGNLSSAEALLFEEMLSENPDLIEEISQMQQTLDSVYNPPEIAPPADLRDRLLATATAQNTTIVTVKTSTKNLDTATSKSKLAGILGAIALFAIALLGFNNYRLWRIANTADVVTASNKRTYLLRGENLSQTVEANLVVSENLNATLIANNLPSLPPEKVYALWTVVGKNVPYTTDEKGAILTAVFQVDATGNFSREIAVPQPHLEPKAIKKMAITVEDISAPQAHTGSIFISTQ